MLICVQPASSVQWAWLCIESFDLSSSAPECLLLLNIDLQVDLERFHERGYTPSAMIRKYCNNRFRLPIVTRKGVVDHDNQSKSVVTTILGYFTNKPLCLDPRFWGRFSGFISIAAKTSAQKFFLVASIYELLSAVS